MKGAVNGNQVDMVKESSLFLIAFFFLICFWNETQNLTFAVAGITSFVMMLISIFREGGSNKVR
jgi:uncharacterized membrane protein YccC